MSENDRGFEAGIGSNASKDPVRIVFITKKTSARVQGPARAQVMSYPHVILREVIAFQILTIVLVLIALFWDAPLEQLANPLTQVVITTGGTGITSRDTTFEVIDALLDKRLDGFGELFRMLSYEDIGSAAIMSRACAGLSRGKVIISLPGSEHAVRLAMAKLILPELGHMVREAGREK